MMVENELARVFKLLCQIKSPIIAIFVAQPLLAVRFCRLQRKPHSQEWLCYLIPLENRAGLDYAVLWDDDDTIANVIAFPVKVPEAFFID